MSAEDIPVPAVTEDDATLPHAELVELIADIAQKVMAEVVDTNSVAEASPVYQAHQFRNGVIQVLRQRTLPMSVIESHVEWPPLMAADSWSPKHRRAFAALVLAIYNH